MKTMLTRNFLEVPPPVVRFIDFLLPEPICLVDSHFLRLTLNWTDGDGDLRITRDRVSYSEQVLNSRTLLYLESGGLP